MSFPSGAGRVSVSIYSRSARMRNVICVTVGKQVGYKFKSGGYGWMRVLKIRPVQDSGWRAETEREKFISLHGIFSFIVDCECNSF